MAKMRVQGSRVIISGHETTKEECNAVTLMCDEMAKSKDFRLVEYRPGYAEFEAVGQAEDLKFVPEPSSITMNFDSGITSVEMSGDAELTWTQSGTNLSFNGTGLGSYTFTVICADGKVLDSVDLSSLYSYTNYTRDSENVFSLTGDTTPSGEITLTSKVAPSVPTPDWANSFVKVGSTVTCDQCGGSGTYSWTETGTLSEPCTSCAGSGMMGAEMCGACGGSGSMTVETVIEHNDPCPNCQATGVISTSENKAVEKVWIKQNGQLVQIFGEVPVYTVTNTFTNCTSNNSATTATQGASYTATITASDGYTLDGATVSVTMGGTDITSTAYADGVVTIASVTGDIVVTVTAVESGPTISGVWTRVSTGTPEDAGLITQDVSFTSKEVSYTSYRAEGQNSDYSLKIYYDDVLWFHWVSWDGFWVREWRTIVISNSVDFGETPQSVSQEFYDYFTSYMYKQS